MKKLKLLDTFAGIGGFSYAAEKIVGGFETTQFIEIDPFCQKVLKKHWSHVPIHNDIKTFTAEPFQFDCISGGFPCQDISNAGLQKGITKNTRSGLFYELMRVIRMVRPQYVVLENVAAILNRGLDIVLRELSEAGYNAEWSVISASSLGACHQRSRWWLVAYPNDIGQQERWLKTRNQVITRENSQSKWSTNTSDFKRQGDDGTNKTKSTLNENTSRSSDGGKAISTKSGGVCEISKKTNNNQGANRKNNNKENNYRTLVQKGQSRFQLSKHRELGGNKTTSEGDTIRHGNDNSTKQRMDSKEPDVTNTDSTRSQRRLLQFNKKLQETRHIRQKDTLSSSDTDSTRTQSDRTRQTKPVWSNAFFNSKERRTIRRDWTRYVSEPCLCRGNDGLRGRVHRLKALGNSVVPQVAAIPLQRVIDIEKNINK